MGIPLDDRRPAPEHRKGKRIGYAAWAILMGRPQGGIAAQGTDHLSERDRRDIGVTKQDIASRFDHEMAKLQTIMFR